MARKSRLRWLTSSRFGHELAVHESETGTGGPETHWMANQAKIRISPTYGCAMKCSLVGAWENTLEGDTEIQRQEGLHVEVSLAPSHIRNRPGRERRQCIVGRPVGLVE